jgi:hypothetical protein
MNCFCFDLIADLDGHGFSEFSTIIRRDIIKKKGILPQVTRKPLNNVQQVEVEELIEFE